MAMSTNSSGDGILAVFSGYRRDAEPGGHAFAGRQVRDEMVTAPAIQDRDCMHSGEVRHRNVGSSDKMESPFWAIQSIWRRASRVLNKEHKTKPG